MKTSNNFYNKNLKKYARDNRKNATPAERFLWSKLRKKQVLGFRFLRQRPVFKYIADFLQPEIKLIIEIDGNSHEGEKWERDLSRQRKLEDLGFHFLRFTEFEVRTRIDDVMTAIYMWLEENTSRNSSE